MKTLFSVGSLNENTPRMTLLLEIGSDNLLYGFINEQSRSFELIRYYSIDEFEMEESLETILQDLKKENPLRVIVCSGLPQAMLTPQFADVTTFNILDVIYDLNGSIHLSDSIPEWQMVTMYAISENFHTQIKGAFPDAEFLHAYTPFVKMSNGINGHQMSLHFSTQCFRVLIKKDEKVQLAQTYSYKTPLDVIYFIIKICSELEIKQSEVSLIISGLIDEKSALYTELHSYFLHLQFAENPIYTLPANEYPPYFFTSIYNLASCAL